MRALRRRVLVLPVLAALLAAACTDGPDTEPDDTEDAGAAAAEAALHVAVASFDLHVGQEQRLLAGLATADRGLIAFGEIELEVGAIDEQTGELRDPRTVTASFLPVPGDAPEGDGAQPTVLVGQPGAGVYETFVDLDEPGPWQVRATAELADGTTREGSAAFQVGEQPQVPAVGEEAPRTHNLTVDDVDGDEVLPVMVDSRAQDPDAEVPDPHIHDTTIAASIEEGRPVVALFATPVYCVSRFCGPITEVFADLAQQYGDRADFVHVEIWRDFDEQQLNEAAAEWIQTPTGGNEPWAFLIGDDGTIEARWDNVLDADGLVAHLEALPVMTHTGTDHDED